MRQGERLRMSSAIVVYKYQQFVTRLHFMMNTKYEIQCAVRGCTSKRGGKKNVSIRRFRKRENAGQRWIEACANPYLPRLEYIQVVERQFFVCH